MHGPESFAALLATAFVLMVIAAVAPKAWYLPAMLGIGLIGLALAFGVSSRRRIGMGMLSAVLTAVLLPYISWLFMWMIPGLVISIFK